MLYFYFLFLLLCWYEADHTGDEALHHRIRGNCADLVATATASPDITVCEDIAVSEVSAVSYRIPLPSSCFIFFFIIIHLFRE